VSPEELAALHDWERLSRALPAGATTTVENGGGLLGMSRDYAYRMVRARLAGDEEAFPVKPITVGRRIYIPVLPLLRLLGVEPNHGPESVRPGGNGAKPPGPTENDSLTERSGSVDYSTDGGAADRPVAT
jgi:hypothetical protein